MASATPNPIATPGGSSIRGSVRGSVRSTPGQTPGQTPLRDELRINSELTDDETQEKMLRMQVMSGLSQLPGPKNEYQIQVPEMDEGGMNDNTAAWDAVVSPQATRSAHLPLRSAHLPSPQGKLYLSAVYYVSLRSTELVSPQLLLMHTSMHSSAGLIFADR